MRPLPPLPARQPKPKPPPSFGMCGACRESDCECCDLLVWGGPCDCGCFRDPTIRAPFTNRPTLVYIRYVPVPPQRKQRSHCKRGHKLSGANVYQENGSGRRRCWTCRRASWRRYQYRKANALLDPTAPTDTDLEGVA